MPSNLITSAFKTKNDPATALWSQTNITMTYDGVPVNTTLCRLQFHIPEDMGPPVLFYYHLTNFYQNHRRYVASFFDKQLKGDAVTGSQVNSSGCTPLTYDPDTLKPYYPCGLIANSMFNDTFTSPVMLNLQDQSDSNATYQMENNTNIAWASDASLYGPTKSNMSDIMPPPYWRTRYPNGYTATNPPPNPAEWQAFQVWMRTAGLPTFSKLYQRNDNDAMQTGDYVVEVTDSE